MTSLVLLLVTLGCESRVTAADIAGPSSPPNVSSVTVAAPAPSLMIGEQAQLTVSAKDALGNEVPGVVVTWTTSAPDVASVTSQGVATAVAPGTATITAATEGKTGVASLSVTSVPPASGAGAPIALALRRFDGLSGNVVVSNAIPLAPGALRPTDLGRVRLLVAGVEQPVYLELLEGRHPDGSLRSVLVAFNYTFGPNDNVPGQLVIGQARSTPNLAKPAVGRSRPNAVALPTDPNYLVSTNIVGRTVTAAAVQQWGSMFAKYDADFAQYEAYQWNLEGERCNNYYDRGLAYYAQWVRTGNPEYWRRGTLCVWNYRTGYLEPNNYGTSPHWSQVEGLEAHYLLTGDDSSRTAVKGVAKVLEYWLPYMDSTQMAGGFDDRIRARTIMATLTAWRINAGGNAAMYKTQLDQLLPKVLRTQSPDGHDAFLLTCQLSLNYMAGQLNDALIKYYLYYNKDPRIPPFVKRSVDFLWGSQWVESAKAFQYLSGVCPTIGDTTPAPDLNNLIVNGFAFTYAQTHDATYKLRADATFEGAVLGSFLAGSKQFNQQYTSSFLYLDMRQ